jgi:glycolate oxidase iron-sulfur subunit
VLAHLLAREQRADGEAAAEGLGGGEEIGLHPLPLVRPEAPGASDTGLHLVETEERAGPIAQGPRRARVAFFGGCITQVSFASLHAATIRVLTANGCEVVVPEGQICCGALAAHAGVRDVARAQARVNLEVFLSGEFDAVVTNTAGCGSTLKEYDQLFPASDTAHQHALAFREKMRDATEFLDGLGQVAILGKVSLRVTYQDSCHLLHGQKVREAPRRLITAVPGVELVEMRLADNCCGSAGVYNVTQTQTSMLLLTEKMECARQTRAEAIVTANPGCLLQMRAGAEIHGTGQQVLHVFELLDRSLAAATSRQ